MRVVTALFVAALATAPALAQERPVLGLIPKAQKPIAMDGKLTGWDGAFVTPVHVGHPDFANRGGQFLYLWDEKNLYIGLRCLDQKPAHTAPDNQIWNGDAVEFYLDTRRGAKLGAPEFGPGTLHMFYTPFTKTDVRPRIQVRDLPAFKGLKLQGAEVAAARTPWGYTAELKLPWKNFPGFTPRPGEVIGIDCELCSSDGGPRVDRTFVYSSPAAVGSPSAFGRARLVEKIDAAALRPLGRALLPLALTRSTNYAWLYGTVCVSPTIEGRLARVEGKLLDAAGKVRKTSTGSKKTLDGGFTLWTGSWELFDLPPGVYTLELVATDRAGAVITSRAEQVLHGAPRKAPPAPGQPPPERFKKHRRIDRDLAVRGPEVRQPLQVQPLRHGLRPVALQPLALQPLEDGLADPERAFPGFPPIAPYSSSLATPPNGFSSAPMRYPMQGGIGVPSLCSRSPRHCLWKALTTSGVKMAGARKAFLPSTIRWKWMWQPSPLDGGV
jgi:hypothetical protein